MTTPLTDEQLAEIEAGLEGVTTGPWRWESEFYDSLRQSTPGGYCGDEVMGAETRFESMSPYISVSAPDATHIARLNPQTVAAWLARDKAMRAQIEMLAKAIDAALTHLDSTSDNVGEGLAWNHLFRAQMGIGPQGEEEEDLLDLKPSNFGLGQLVPDASKTGPTVGGFDRTTPPHWRDKEEK